MPIYEYRCKKGHTFEVMQRMGDDSATKCQVCGASVERIFTPIAVHFKGSGFYSTDYGSKKRSRELKEAGEGTGEAGEGTGKHAKQDGSSSSDSASGSNSDSKSDSTPDKPASTAVKSDGKGSSSSSASN